MNFYLSLVINTLGRATDNLAYFHSQNLKGINMIGKEKNIIVLFYYESESLITDYEYHTRTVFPCEIFSSEMKPYSRKKLSKKLVSI